MTRYPINGTLYQLKPILENSHDILLDICQEINLDTDGALYPIGLDFTRNLSALLGINLFISYGTLEIFQVVERATQKTVGLLGLYDVDLAQGNSSILSFFTKEDRKAKVFSEPVKLLMNYAWNQLNLQRLTALVAEHDTMTQTQYSAFGFVKEGGYRKAIRSEDTNCDVLIYGCLRAESRVTC